MTFGKLDEESTFGDRLTEMMKADNADDPSSIDTPKRDGGTLHGWYSKMFTFESKKDPFTVVFGHISGDSRWRDGKPIKTSPVITLNTEDRILETENTIYRLGNEATEQDIMSIGMLRYDIPSGPEDYHVDDVTVPEPLSEEEQAKLDAMLQAMIF